MKVLLVFPPQWTPFRPYLSLPSLTAYLRRNAITVVQKDFNLESYELLLSEGYLSGVGERLRNRFAALELKDSLAPGIEQRYYNDLYMAKSIVAQLASKVENARKVYHDPKAFYDPEKLSAATHTLNQALSAISLAYFPTKLELSAFDMASFKGSFEDLKLATQNKAENPYIGLYEDYLLPFIRGEAPDVIGITVSGESQLIPALTLSRLLKASGIKAHITVGGYVITLLADVLTKYPDLYEIFFDSAILNDGEKPLLELVKRLERGQSLEDVPNLIHRDGGVVVSNKKEPPENINSLPAPDFDGLPLERYFSPEPVLPILSERGCYWSKCAFCTHSLAYGLTYQVRDAIKVIDDMAELSQKYGAVHFALSDEGTSPSSMAKMSDEIMSRSMNVRCSTSIRPEKQFTPELCRKMAAAGFKEVYIGLESSCDRVLGRINKGTTCALNEEIMRNVHEAGIWDHVYIMFGFPGETLVEARQTFDFLRRNKGTIRSLGISNFSVGRGSMVMRHPEVFGVSLLRSGAEVDFKLYFDYSVMTGLSQIEGWDLTEECFATVASELEGEALLDKIGHHYDKGCILPLYLSRHEHDDPSLKSIAKTKPPVTKASGVVSRWARPELKPGVILDRLCFNLRTIRQNIVDNCVDEAFPEPAYNLFDADSGKFKRIPDQTAEILRLCDGISTITMIARNIARKYRLSLAATEAECLALLKSLADEGYLNVSAS